MNRVLIVCVLAVIALVAPTVANAGPISTTDPIIGVRGLSGPSGSGEITDGTPQPFEDPCDAALGSDYICRALLIPVTAPQLVDGIFSLTLQFLEAGIPISLDALFIDPLSQFQFRQDDVDNTMMRLSGTGPLTCGTVTGPGLESALIPRTCTIGDEIEIFMHTEGLPGPFQVTVFAVNDIPNSTTVPEPTALLAMGVGLSAFAGLRLRRKTN